MARVSIKDIAEKAGVSIAAVSFVLNDKEKKGRISKEVADKIRRTAKELNYRPNQAAQSLRTGRTNTLGLIVADISNPFFAKLARCAENIAENNNYQVMFGSSDESSVKFQKLVDLFIEKNVDGMILSPPEKSEKAIMQLINAKIPCVLVDRSFEDLPVSSVQIDNIGASFSLTNHMISNGCKKIGFVAYNMGLPNIKKRYEGYCKALRSAGIECEDDLICSVAFTDSDDKVKESLSGLVSRGIDSLLFATNRVGIQSLYCLREICDYKKLKYASIDGIDGSKLADLDITCVEQPIDEIADRALHILFKKIDNTKYDLIENIVLQTQYC